ncbi:MAG TPA: NFACT RNA binding domain-containing protein, partial [Ignavibacteria bacterium]|nr:NFACT RNA binding domain-containing protein [Ignavibacteria bacterium]
DRAIIFRLENDTEMIFTFFTNKANCYVVKNSVVVNSFKNKEEYSGKKISDVISLKTGDKIRAQAEGYIKDLLKMNYRKAGEIYLEEIIHRLSISTDEVINESMFDLLKNQIDEILILLENPEFILYRKEDDALVSLIKLHHISGYEKVNYENVNHLLQEYLKFRFRHEKIDSYKATKLKEYSNKISHIEKKVSGIENQLLHCENSDKLRKMGEVIIQNSYKIKKGIKFFNYEGSGEISEKIKLKESLSPVENANAYFEKYKKQKASVDLLKLKLKNLEAEKQKLKSEFEGIKELQDIKKILKEEKKSAVSRNDETSRFRKFKVKESYEVWVGKDSVSNDLLTTKYSSQNDLWFHVRGASGSHTVLKLDNKKEIAPKEVIYAAASIAAYYSKARNSSSVPVAYCEKKYVKKKKGFKAGSVIMEREKVIFVKPSLPEEK